MEGGREKEEKEGGEGDFEMPYLHCFHVGTFFSLTTHMHVVHDMQCSIFCECNEVSHNFISKNKKAYVFIARHHQSINIDYSQTMWY